MAFVSPQTTVNPMDLLPALEAKYPTFASDTEADAHNARILAVRGLHTTATGMTLFKLADRVLHEDLDDVVVLEHVPDNEITNDPSAVSTSNDEDDNVEQNNSENKSDEDAGESSEKPVITFKPFYFFFYGSLQVRNVLNRVCVIRKRGLFGVPQLVDEEPEESTYIENAHITGWTMKMWGPYPALIPDDNGAVSGVAWLCEKPEYVGRLESYESSAYRMAFCDISVPSADGSGVEIIRNARTFVSTLNADELEDGEFDLSAYRKTTMAKAW
ncbi:hypothetical protein F5Y10DRAFT_252989 [Nemania abortiva]|nr:hypothetical protein F5Y10DRAFT_252989 [Nemania abortiva]